MDFAIHNQCERDSKLFADWCAIAGSPMEHPDWLLSWWELYADGLRHAELFLVAVREQDRLVAIAPLYLSNGVLRLLGDGRVCTDHVDILILRLQLAKRDGDKSQLSPCRKQTQN